MNHIQIKRGHDIRVSGVPNRDVISAPRSKTVSVLPNSFKSVKPKLMVQEGDEVKIGSPLFFDKTKPEVRWASPASGNIASIQFGARRAIEKIEITVQNKDKVSLQTLSQIEFDSADRKKILDLI